MPSMAPPSGKLNNLPGKLPLWAKPSSGDAVEVLTVKALVVLPVGDAKRISLEELRRVTVTSSRHVISPRH